MGNKASPDSPDRKREGSVHLHFGEQIEEQALIRGTRPWETAPPRRVEITIDAQCYPIEKRATHVRLPIHAAAVALYEHGNVDAYSIAQALDSVSRFWERLSTGDAKMADFENDFTGEKRRNRKKTRKVNIQWPTDEGGRNGD